MTAAYLISKKECVFSLEEVRSVLVSDDMSSEILDGRIEMPIFRSRHPTVFSKLKYWYEDTFIGEPTQGPYGYKSGNETIWIRLRLDGNSDNIEKVTISSGYLTSPRVKVIEALIAEKLPGLECEVKSPLP
ncbi:MAG: hypothetical protein ACSHX7_01195 [Luteolibacter sp.]